MKFPTVIVTVVVTVLGTGLLIAAAPQGDASPAHKGQQEESARKVKELQMERITILREVAEFTNKLYRVARVNYDQVYDAKQLLLKAELEIAENDADRIKLYEKFVEAMKEYEEIAAIKKQEAQGTSLGVLRAKAIRLEAEIALEQVKARATK